MTRRPEPWTLFALGFRPFFLAGRRRGRRAHGRVDVAAQLDALGVAPGAGRPALRLAIVFVAILIR